jgi:hypothetical protein
MNRLPYETLIDIFSRLFFEDKLQCALTCRDWHTKIRNSVLYAKIGFKYSQNELKDQISSLHDQGLGHQIVDLRVVDMSDPFELSKVCPNLKSLEVENWICNDWNDKNNASIVQNWKKLKSITERTGYFEDSVHLSHYHSLTMNLLDTSFHMKSLTSLTFDLFHVEELLPELIEQLKHAPALEYLSLDHAEYVDSNMLDLLNKNNPSLETLELLQCLFSVHNLEERRPLTMDLSVAYNLHSLNISFEHEDDLRLTPYDLNVKRLKCFEYISHKYPNLTKVTMVDVDLSVSPQRINNFVLSYDLNKAFRNHLERAFYSWTLLKKFDLQLVYLSKYVLQSMDDYNIRLEELKVYVYNEADMDQLRNLAQSKQGKIIHKLVITELNRTWNQQFLAYYLNSLDKADCQLKEISIHMNDRNPGQIADHIKLLSPIQMLDYAPSLQTLSMGLSGTWGFNYTTHSQTIQLKHLNLWVLYPYGLDPKWELSTQQHIQQLIYASPLLRSFSLHFLVKANHMALDFRQNTKLNHINYFIPSNNETIGVIQNSQKKWYSYSKLGYYRKDDVFTEDSQRNCDTYDRGIVLHLLPTIRSLYIWDIEHPL